MTSVRVMCTGQWLFGTRTMITNITTTIAITTTTAAAIVMTTTITITTTTTIMITTIATAAGVSVCVVVYSGGGSGSAFLVGVQDGFNGRIGARAEAGPRHHVKQLLRVRNANFERWSTRQLVRF